MTSHIPVMRDILVDALQLQAGEVVVDCTLGRGGHTKAMLDRSDVTVIGIDRDPTAISLTSEKLSSYGDRFVPVRAEFSQIGRVLHDMGLESVDVVIADIGVSSPQLDDGTRGFSFQQDGPIDMRMDPDAPLSALEIVNKWSLDELVRILKEYGEERRPGRVARIIVEGRPWSTTLPLAGAVADVLGRGKGKIHPATRTFQALRIAVNDELKELSTLLEDSVGVLSSGGRLAIISFHSLEDRIVKQYFAKESGKNGAKDVFGHPIIAPRLSLQGKLLRPDQELDTNPRARSARLRIARRLPWNN